MTSDAKIGLLLGLVFIFIIAFLINGLPSLSSDINNNELTTNMTSSQNGPPALGARERKVSLEVINALELVKNHPTSELKTSPPQNQVVRFTTPLPSARPVVKQTTQPPLHVLEWPKPQPEKILLNRTKEDKTPKPQTYFVTEGDSLAFIALKFYGPQDGNKKVNIGRIFEANRTVLKSPDQIYPGQKLLIPPLVASGQDKSRVAGVFSAELFEKVKSVGAKHLSTPITQKRQNRTYVVQEYDSLWQIAVEQLGSGARYTEIAELNTDIINDEDTLAVGTRLKMPAR